MASHRKNEVIQLSEIDHVLKKSGMYIGDSSRSSHERWHLNNKGKIINGEVSISPGLLKLFDEIISNSIDEAFRTNFEFANKIDVTINKNEITVRDNGRGIPVLKSKGAKITQAEMAFTSLRAGGNFEDDNVVSIGTHGLGSTLVNIMSKTFNAETSDGKKKLSISCTNNLSSAKVKITKCNKRYTQVFYSPDFNQFEGCSKFELQDISMIKKRLSDLTICFPEIKFTLNGSNVRQGSAALGFRRYCALYSDDCVTVEDTNYKIAVFPVEEPTHISFVNGIDTFKGGTHVDVVSRIICDELLTVFKKKYKKLDIKIGDVKNHLGFIVFTNSIKGVKFNSQTKEQITNTVNEILPVFSSLSSERGFFNKILKNPDIMDPIIEAKRLKLEAKERAALKKAQRNAKRIKVAAHVPANSKDPEKKILFLTEGASASGQLLSVRDTDIHGSYPLRGKVMNVSGKKANVIMKNQELCNLMSILGLNIGETAVNLSYGKIGLLMDADTDGNSIAALLMNFFAYWPELFKENRIVLVKTPILLARKAKETKRYYSIEDYEKDINKLKGYEITYIKGLGSLPIQEYKKIINEPIFIPISLSNECLNMLVVAFGDNANLRKEWLEEK